MVKTAFSLESLQYMMMYAWSLWPSGSRIFVGGAREVDAPLDRLALILGDSILKAEKSGLYREYVAVKEDTLVPRGRFLISKTIQLRAKHQQTISVETDEFSVDCLVNRAVKEALLTLLTAGLSAEAKEALSLAKTALSNVSDVSLTSRELNTALSTVRRGEYRLALSIAVLLKESRLFSNHKNQQYYFETTEIDDDALFRRLYEKFLREFYRFNLKGVSVGGRQYRWSANDAEYIPIMQTDINIENKSEVIVIDAKCTPKVITKRTGYGERFTLNSNHLYQMFSYMAHASYANPGKQTTGVLLYPEYENEIDEVMQTSGGSLRVKTINFLDDWETVSAQLLDLVGKLES